ncbi:MAG: response regulator transcription factor [Chitinophagales bacterium]
MSSKIAILLADDHPIVREGLRTIIETQVDFEVVGEASNGVEAVEMVSNAVHKIDVLLLDLEMPLMDGVEVIHVLQQKSFLTKVIVFTVFDTDERIMSAIKAGAKGYLLKGASRKEIFEAIRVVHSGGSLLQPVVASKLMQHISDGIEKPSLRELEVLKWMAKGLKNKQIAVELFISERTVKFHVSAILSKLGAKNRTEAVQIAVKRGFVDL